MYEYVVFMMPPPVSVSASIAASVRQLPQGRPDLTA
jgi:hypothetical protein